MLSIPDPNIQPASKPEEVVVQAEAVDEPEPAQAITPAQETPEVVKAKAPQQEEVGTYDVQEGGRKGVDLSLTGGIARIRLRSGPVRCLVYGPDQQSALAADDEVVYFLDLNAKEATATRPAHRDPITCLSFSPDGSQAFSGDEDGGLLLWDVPRRRPVRWLEGHRHGLNCATFSPSGKYAVSGDTDGIIRLWEVGTGKPIELFESRWDQSVNCVCFSPDGRKILAVGGEGKARLWSLRTGEVICKLKRGAKDLHAVAFGADGATVLASSAVEFKISRWDASTGERRPCFVGFGEKQPRISQTFVTPDGHSVLALGYARDPGPRFRSETPSGLPGALPGFLLGGVVGAAIGAVVTPIAQTAASAADTALYSALHQQYNNGYFIEFWSVDYETAAKGVPLGPERPLSVAPSVDGHRVLVGYEGYVNLVGV
jgi:hypothetical protein